MDARQEASPDDLDSVRREGVILAQELQRREQHLVEDFQVRGGEQSGCPAGEELPSWTHPGVAWAWTGPLLQVRELLQRPED